MSGIQGTCSECGSKDELWAWYEVAERQSIWVVVLDSGEVVYDYTGITDSGDAGSDTSFYCGACGRETDTIEDMVGAAPVARPPTPEEELATIKEWLADALDRNQIVHEIDRRRARAFLEKAESTIVDSALETTP